LKKVKRTSGLKRLAEKELLMLKWVMVGTPLNIYVGNFATTNSLKALNIKIHIACQHLEFSRKDYQLRCTLAIVTFGGGAASID
jgi:hypothetical protein